MQTKTPISSLQLFPQFNRDTFLQSTGTQAPIYDPALQIKNWFDPSKANADSAGSVTYTYWDQLSGMLRQVTMTNRVAAAVNLPGTFTYPVYSVLPTVAITINGLNGQSSPIPAAYLSSEADAKALAAQLGGSVMQAAPSGWPFTDDWGTETRRQWLVVINGSPRNAAQLIAQMYRQGIGAPGHWVIGTGEPTWVSEIPTGEVKDLRPWVPVPIRPLMEGETIETTPMGAWVVTGTPDVATGGGFTDADRAMLSAIAQKVGA